jgi:phosphoribosylanthranilate isomerase
MPTIKICGLTRAADVRAALDAGAAFGGVILAPGSPRTVPPEGVPALFADLPLPRVGVFVDEEEGRLERIAAAAGLAIVQLHGDESPAAVERIRARTGVEVWKAIRPRSGEEFLREARRYEAVVDGLLLDGWSRVARGGTGARFPWEEVARHRDRLRSGLRLVVAGGLTAGNVAQVVERLSPDTVDVSSGVESAPGVKSPASIRNFADAVRRAPAQEGVR